MKQLLCALAVATQLGLAGTAMATTVNFSTLVDPNTGIPITVDITNSQYTLDGITFSYDDFGSGVDFASIDPAGIFGSTYGNLKFDFNTPTTALNFDFSLLGTSADVTEALLITFDNNNNVIADTLVSATFSPYDPQDLSLGGDAFGSLAFSGAAFNRAQMLFSLDAPYFTVANLDYTYTPSSAPAPVPEPATVLLMGFGLAGLGGQRLRRRRQG